MFLPENLPLKLKSINFTSILKENFWVLSFGNSVLISFVILKRGVYHRTYLDTSGKKVKYIFTF